MRRAFIAAVFSVVSFGFAALDVAGAERPFTIKGGYLANEKLLKAATFRWEDLTTSQREGEKALKKKRPKTIVKYNPIHTTPRNIFNYEGYLTTESGDSPESIGKSFLRENAQLYRLTAQDLNLIRYKKEYTTRHNGMRHVFFNQQVDGIPVDGELRFNLTGKGEIINTCGRVIPDLEHRINTTVPEVTAVEAVRIAAGDIGISIEDELKVISSKKENPMETVVTRGPFSRDVKLSLTFFALDEESARLAWKIGNLCSYSPPLAYEYLVDAVTGQVLARHSLAHSAMPVRWLVFPDDSPQPLVYPNGNPRPVMADAVPGEGEPEVDPEGRTRRVPRTENGDCAPGAHDVAPLEDENGEAYASPLGWVSDGDRTTTGNNAIAFANVDQVFIDIFNIEESLQQFIQAGVITEARINGDDGGREFHFPLVLEDGDQPPEGFHDASTTDLFYWSNFAHDYLYGLGFDEQAGNYQADNFGRGGLDGDPLYACAQYVTYTNSLFFTFPEGESPVMLIFIWPNDEAPTGLDGSYDHAIVIHEYCHGLSNRLVGRLGYGAADSQSGAMGEAWSDWFALSMLSSEDDPIDGSYPVGAYAVQNIMGIRRYPYSTDIEQVNPLTYRHIGVDPVPLFPGIQHNETFYDEDDPEPSAVHNAGEIWCATLWEVRANYLQRYTRVLGFERAKKKVEQLIVDGLKLTPPYPTFLDARDAILLAEREDGDGADDSDILWQAFAKRGMGYFAFDGGIDLRFDVVEDFTVPRDAGPAIVMEQVGSRIELEVIDFILDDAEEVEIEVIADQTGDRETVTVHRDDEQPFNLFRGSIDLSFDGGVRAGDDILQPVDSDTVTAVHNSDLGEIRESIIVFLPFENVGSHRRETTADLARLLTAVDVDADGASEILINGEGEGLFLLDVEDGALRDIAGEAGLDGLALKSDACWGDYDNDGDVDLWLSSFDDNKLLENGGENNFAPAAADPQLHNPEHPDFEMPAPSNAASWSDYDRDGNLDLCVAYFFMNSRLYRNDGEGGFADETDRAVPGAGGMTNRESAWADFTNDGYPELITNERRYENLRDGTFAEGRVFLVPDFDLGINDTCWADYDNDGDFDSLLCTRKHGTQLFRNNGAGRFTNVSEDSGMVGEGAAGQSIAIDHDNDTDLDLISIVDGGVIFYNNNGDGTFRSVDMSGILGLDEAPSGSLVLGNVDGDAMPELIVSHAEGMDIFAFPENDNNYLCVRPVVDLCERGERAAIGARIEVDLDNDGDFENDALLVRQIEGFGQSQMVAHFGLGDAERVGIRVLFPDGGELVVADVRANGDEALEVSDRDAEYHDTDIVVIVDRSNSMRLRCLDGETRKIDAAKMAADLFVDIIEPDDNHRLSVVRFGEWVEEFDPPIILEDLTEDRLEGLHDAIDGTGTGGVIGEGTHYADALQAAFDQLSDPDEQPNPRQIVHFFTDGKENRHPYAASIYPQMAAAGIEIHSTGFGADIEPEVLDEMAEASGATFAQVALDDDALIERFIDVARLAMRMEFLLDPTYTVSWAQPAQEWISADASTRKLKFILTWEGREPFVAGIKVVSPDGVLLEPPMTGVRESQGKGYAVLHVDLTECQWVQAEGTWQITLSPGPKFPGGERDVELFVLGDTDIDYEAEVRPDEKNPHSVQLLCRMINDGTPVTSASSTVRWTKPLYPKGNAPDPVELTIFDDGMHGDGKAKDGLFGAYLYLKEPGCHSFHFVSEGYVPGKYVATVQPRREALVSCTIKKTAADPADGDTDGDGISDYDEVNYNGDPDYVPYDPRTGEGKDLNAAAADTDGDGFTDYMELTYDTDPLDPDSKPRRIGINFQPAGAGISAGHLKDEGGSYRMGRGYGWR